MDMLINAAFYFTVAYILGSIPFGLLIAKFAGKGDIREIGSGNIGATNVLRTGSKTLALLTVLADIGKGMVGVFLSFSSGSAFVILGAALMAVIGHMYPIWLKFKGGKGVATTLGVMLALTPMLGATMCLIWLISALIFRISSLAALLAFATAPFFSYFMLGDEKLTVLALLIDLLVFWKHRENIQRLIRGQEPRIGSDKNKTEKAENIS